MFLFPPIFSLYSEDEDVLRVNPLLGNVCFASSQFGFCFTLASFAQLYSETFASNEASIDPKELARRY